MIRRSGWIQGYSITERRGCQDEWDGRDRFFCDYVTEFSENLGYNKATRSNDGAAGRQTASGRPIRRITICVRIVFIFAKLAEIWSMPFIHPVFR
jgi:hypothetical protein